MSDAPIIRPSELARFWGLHPKTVNAWIRDGRLAATRSPGNQYRVKIADVRAFCELENLPVPPFIVALARRAIFIGFLGSSEAVRRSLKRALRPHAITLEVFDDAYRGLFAAVLAPPTILAIDAAAQGVDADRALRALRATNATAHLPILMLDVASAARGASLLGAGATRAIPRSRRADLAREIKELLTL